MNENRKKLVSLFEIAERNVMYYLYKKTYTEKQETDSSEFLNSCSIEVLNPNPIRYRLHCEKIGFHRCREEGFTAWKFGFSG